MDQWVFLRKNRVPRKKGANSHKMNFIELILFTFFLSTTKKNSKKWNEMYGFAYLCNEYISQCWNNVSKLPTPSEKNTLFIFLKEENGYDLWIWRNYVCFLSKNIQSHWIPNKISAVWILVSSDAFEMTLRVRLKKWNALKRVHTLSPSQGYEKKT